MKNRSGERKNTYFADSVKSLEVLCESGAGNLFGWLKSCAGVLWGGSAGSVCFAIPGYGQQPRDDGGPGWGTCLVCYSCNSRSSNGRNKCGHQLECYSGRRWRMEFIWYCRSKFWSWFCSGSWGHIRSRSCCSRIDGSIGYWSSIRSSFGSHWRRN
jgi:hypothetical protein